MKSIPISAALAVGFGIAGCSSLPIQTNPLDSAFALMALASVRQ